MWTDNSESASANPDWVKRRGTLSELADSLFPPGPLPEPEQAAVSTPFFQIVLQRTLGPSPPQCGLRLLSKTWGSEGCGEKPLELGSRERDTQSGREKPEFPRPQGAGGQSRGHAGLLGDDWRVRLAQKAFDQPGQDTGRLCPPRLLTGSCVSAAVSPAPGAGTDLSWDWGGEWRFLRRLCACLPSLPSHLWRPSGPTCPFVLALVEYESHGFFRAGPGCFLDQPRALEFFYPPPASEQTLPRRSEGAFPSYATHTEVSSPLSETQSWEA